MRASSISCATLLLSALVACGAGGPGSGGESPSPTGVPAASPPGSPAPGGGDAAAVGRDGGGVGGGGADGGAVDGGAADGAVAPDGAKDTPPSGDAGSSCVGIPATCGGNKDCCASNVVTGGAFNRSSDGAFPATVSTFKLDVYEVTVARFRAFVNDGKGTQASPPAPGAGAHPKIAGSGWDPAWNGNLDATTAALQADLACNPAYPVWTDAPGGNETRPIHCVSWFEAFAFCAWDGGRLATEAEWNYAAAGGSEQREYAWGAGIDHGKASYDCSGRGLGTCVFSDLLPVGSSSPQGDGKWGQADLTGSVWEYTLDYFTEPYRLTTCADCADLQVAPDRTFRGGSFANASFYEVTSVRIGRSPGIRDYDVGIRCAR